MARSEYETFGVDRIEPPMKCQCGKVIPWDLASAIRIGWELRSGDVAKCPACVLVKIIETEH